jgi:HK97 gp10 family phage protein
MAEIQGLRELEREIAANVRKLQDALPQIAQDGADIVFKEIDSRMPRDTGDMAAHLDENEGSRGNSASVTVEVVNSGPHGEEHKAIFQEYGTSRMPANPFFRPGIEAARQRVEAQMAQDILRVIEQ